jgi:hypothetical protein
MPDDDSVYANDIRWKLSQIRQCVPQEFRPMPDRLDPESLLIQHILELEHLCEEYASIAETYRTIAETSIEMVARQEQQSQRMRALIQNMSDELMLRRS